MKVDPAYYPVIHPPRKLPFSLHDKVRMELERMSNEGIITRITEPTPWVNSMVVVQKKDKIRIVIDPRDLNKAIKREHYPMKTVEEVATRLAGAAFFSVLDVEKAFWHVKLDSKSAKLTTFNSPFGRFYFNRLPFGIVSAPEVFQRKAAEVIEGLSGVDVIMDDILIWGSTIEEHNERLRATLERIRSANLKLKKDKTRIAAGEVKYIGHVLSKTGLRPDQEKITAIINMAEPRNKKELLRFMGSVNYLGKFIPNLSTLNEPLRLLLKSDVEWHWETKQQQSFDHLKQVITQAPVLRFFDNSRQITLSVDSSSFGLGACLLQEGQPVAYASRSLSSSECNYGQIEKEMLAICFGCSKFHQYIYGQKHVLVESDHKPLESLYMKPLSAAPPRIQRMMLRLQRYDLKVVFKAGKDLHLADTMSRAPSKESDASDLEMFNDFEIHASFIEKHFTSVSPIQVNRLATATQDDVELQQLRQIIMNGWPNHKQNCPLEIQKFWKVRDELSIRGSLLLRGTRIIVPRELQKDMLNRIHSSHLGIELCKRKARETLYWPSMNQQLQETISHCELCCKFRNSQPREPLISHEIPERPWQTVGTDLFQIDGDYYLIIVDYYSKFIEVSKIPDLQASTVANFTMSHFARHGVPDKIVSDNGTHFTGKAYQDMTRRCGCQHVTSSPRYPQSNGLAERAVQTIKKLLLKSKAAASDPNIALLELRNTPMAGIGLSPVQLLMGRRTKTVIPTLDELLIPWTPDHEKVKLDLRKKQECSKADYDKHSRQLRPLHTGETVWMKTEKEWEQAVVTGIDEAPRSYIVDNKTGGGTYRRNRRHLVGIPAKGCSPETESKVEKPSESHILSQGEASVELPQHSDSTIQTQHDEIEQTHGNGQTRLETQKRNRHPPSWFKDYVS